MAQGTEISTRQRHFERRAKAAEQGVHLPTEEELLRGMAFFGKRLEADAREYGERLARRIRKRPFAGSDSLVGGLEDLALGVTPAALQGLIADLSQLLECKVFSARDARLRCEIYLAWRGDAKAAAVIATEMGRIALQDI